MAKEMKEAHKSGKNLKFTDDEKEGIKRVVSSWDQEERIIDREIARLENLKSGFSCDLCKHIHKDEISCDAFPDVIPSDINNGIIDHRKPFPGDNGIMFEPKE
ncbi:uncharacterized protein METZ01_LOCUS403464 [marine metagenome]|uniref:Uncharacterized protein n=1 Tax=marine metagenome TaxID=408172 RepID=A0A382VW55_9ZZZZ